MAESSQPTPPHPGLTLHSKSPSVTVHDRVSLSEDNNPPRRDSLEGTRQYYGLQTPTPPTLNRTHSNNSRNSRRKRSGSTSTRPERSIASPAPSVPNLPTSPQRSSVPLPTPRGFLSPRKPAAAVRLENRERALALRQSTSDWQSHDGHHMSDTTSIDFSRTSMADFRSPTPGREMSLDAAIANGPPAPMITSKRDTHWDETVSTKRGSGSVSSPVRQTNRLPEESSDHLIQHSISSATHEKHLNKPVSQARSPPTKPPQKRVKKYKNIRGGGSTFFCGGRMMTGGDSPLSMILSLVVMFGISAVWIATSGVWFWVHGGEYGLVSGGGIGVVVGFVYLFGLTVGSMIAAAFREPGILPRDFDLNPPYAETSSEYVDAVPRELRVGKDIVTVKYCESCKIYRPPRSSHCRLCGHCIDGIDHHCAYIHTCVGKRTYLSFLTFVIAAAISTIYIVIFSAIHFYLLTSHDGISFKDALGQSPGAAVSFALGICVLPPMMFLLTYHVRLLIYNLTTIEQIRASASKSLLKATKRPPNPFAQPSILRNILIASLGRPQFPSWIDASGWDEGERRVVNPGLGRGWDIV